MDAQWVQTIIDRSEPESASLDFKRDLPGNSDGDRQKFAHDVTALANTRGGRIVYGVDEDAEHRAARITPIQGEPGTAEERLNNMIATSIEPRPSGVSIKASTVDGGFVLVVDVPQQYDGPFQAQFQNRIWFKCRVGASNRDMTYGQLRSAFGERSRLLSELRKWRIERLERHLKQIAFQQLADGPWAVLHVMPLAAFGEHHLSLDPRKLAAVGFRFRKSVQGLARFNSFGVQFLPGSTAERVREFVQFFRQGMVEAAWTCRYSGSTDEHQADRYEAIHSVTNAINVANNLKSAGDVLLREGVSSSVYVSLALLNVGNKKMYCSTNDGFGHFSAPQHESDIIFPDQLAERADELVETPRVVAKRLLDEMWQAFGQEQCDDFDESGACRDPRIAAYF